MTTIRPAAVAGRFYPADPQQLREMVEQYIGEAVAENTDMVPSEPPPKALIAPHAGYVYSGPIAGRAYARLLPLRKTIKQVVLLGPAHYVAVQGLGASSADFFETPLGEVPLDQAAIAELLTLPAVQWADEAHAPEHSLEVQLPFLQTVLDSFRLVPLVVGRTTPADVAAVLDLLWNGPETLIVVSSDLSHYHDYETARLLDRQTAEAICHLQPEQLRSERACGFLPISGLLLQARQRNLQPHLLDLRNSGDTAGPRDHVVGYGAFTFTTSA